MSDILMVSPLLDGYTVEKTVMTQRDRTWYSVRHTASGECFVLKHISVPASDAQVRALILSGIYENEQDVLAYYTGLVSEMKQELEIGKKLAQTGCFAGAVDYQIVQKTDGIGYDIYILQALQVPLNELISRNGMTHLRAVNLAIDLCDAIIACREAGYLFANLKPDNIFFVPSGKFLLGDLGLIPLKDLEYAGIPESYIDSFSPPELFDITGTPNLTIDLYSLGMVLYRIYNGNHGPFEDENTNETMADKLRLSGKPLPTPMYADYELAGIITKACAFRIPGRYTSPESLKEALVLYLQRNQIPDSLIVPPLVVDPQPVIVEEEDITAEEPLRMVDAETLDAAFKESFAPSTENTGADTLEETAEALSTQEKTVEPALTVNIAEDPRPKSATPEFHLSIPETPNQETATSEDVSATQPAQPQKEAPASPAEQEAVKVEEVPQIATEPSPSKAEEPASQADDMLSANTVTGPKMPTGSLRMKKGKRSHKQKNLVLEIPTDPESDTETVPESTPDASPVAEVKARNRKKEIPTTITVDSDTSSPVEADSGSAASSLKDAVPSEALPSDSFSISEMSAKPDSTESVDIDQLIASVNEVVGPSDYYDSSDIDGKNEEDSSLSMRVSSQDSGYYDSYQDSSHDDKRDETGEKKKSRWFLMAIIAVLTIALVGVISFLLNNYYVDITELKLVDHSTEYLTVELVTPDAQESFIVTCTDNYGNAYPRTIDSGVYTFSGLRENTAYTVTVIASEYHRLKSGKSYTMTVKTPGTTKISNFTARRGTQVGDVVLNFSSEGPSPEEWQYTYTDSNGIVSGPFPFSDHTALVAGLQEGMTYTFAVKAPADLHLSGETTVEYTLLPLVTLSNLHITDVFDTTISIAWNCEENIPQEWTVTCEAEGYNKTITTSDFKAAFTDIPDFGKDYTFTVTALGMEEAATVMLPAYPILIEDLKAESQEDGTVTVTWNTPAGAPANGWHLAYNTVGSFHIPYVLVAGSEDITSNSATLRGLIPNAEYEIILHRAAEDSSMPVYGETSTTITTPKANSFNGYSIDPAPAYGNDSGNISLWLCPEKEDWTFNDLKNVRTNFSKDERIAVCIQVDSISASEETVTLLYVIRNENGQVVTDESQEFPWDSLWFERRHVNEVPLPKEVGQKDSTPGKYTLEIYIDGQLLAERSFAIA